MKLASPKAGNGPLAEYLLDFEIHLAELGYTRSSVVDHARRLVRASNWLAGEDRKAAELDEGLIARKLNVLHAADRARKLRVGSFKVLLEFLRSHELIPPVVSAPMTPLDNLLDDYRHYLSVERSLARLTLPGYLASARWFLDHACSGDPGRITELSVRHVANFVRHVADVRSPASVNTVVVGVRSLLRWFYANQMITTPLMQATPWLSSGHMSTPPRTLVEGTVKALLATCDRNTLNGARDFAVLNVLVRFGLRPSEVAAMELSDFDWRRGELMIHSKGGGIDKLPITVDVGNAVVAYLKQRGGGPSGRLFMGTQLPVGPLSSSGIRDIVARACLRAGIAYTGTHRLRHGVAIEMLRSGASLPEIGQVLRHRSIQTTAIYAKVDFAALATVARPWPGGAK